MTGSAKKLLSATNSLTNIIIIIIHYAEAGAKHSSRNNQVENGI